MKVDSVQLNNIGELYEAVYNSQTNQELRKSIGAHINRIYQRMSIVIQFSEVTPIEAVMLHKLTNGMVVEMSEWVAPPNDASTPLNAAVSGLSLLMNRIVQDKEAATNGIVEPESFMPLSYLRKTLLVTITGPALGMVFTSNPVTVFHEAFPEKYPWPLEETEELLNAICGRFYDAFYKALLSEINSNDMISDSISYGTYYSQTGDDFFMLSHALTPFGLVGIMHGSEENDDTITNSKRIIPSFKEAFPTPVNDWFFLQTKLFYVVKVPISVYCELELKLPPGAIVDHEYFRILATTPIETSEIETDIPKYSVRLKERFDSYVKEYNSCGPDRILDKMIHIPSDTMVQCIIGLSMEEISYNVGRILYWSTNNLREDSFMQRWLEDVLGYFRDTSKAVFQQFSF